MVKPNYTKPCSACAYAEPAKERWNYQCHRPVDLVTGEPRPRAAADMRAKDGPCGPSKLQFVDAANVSGADATADTNVRRLRT